MTGICGMLSVGPLFNLMEVQEIYCSQIGWYLICSQQCILYLLSCLGQIRTKAPILSFWLVPSRILCLSFSPQPLRLERSLGSGFVAVVAWYASSRANSDLSGGWMFGSDNNGLFILAILCTVLEESRETELTNTYVCRVAKKEGGGGREDMLFKCQKDGSMMEGSLDS